MNWLYRLVATVFVVSLLTVMWLDATSQPTSDDPYLIIPPITEGDWKR